MSAPEKSQPDARTRILDAAERLFTESGYAATSIRPITGEVAVPVALENYHFGSRRGLMEAVFQRTLGSGGASRVRDLDRLEQAAGGEALAVETLVEAFASSALRLRQNDSIAGTVCKQLIGRAFDNPGPGTEELDPAEYVEAVERYKQAFLHALPHLSEADVVWRMYFCVGIISSAMAGRDVMRMTEIYSLGEAGDSGAVLRRLVPFIVAGFRARSGDLPGADPVMHAGKGST